MTKVMQRQTQYSMSLPKQLFLYSLCAVVVVLSKAIGNVALIYMSLALYLFIVVFSDIKDVLQIFLFFLPFSAVIKISPNSVSLCSVAILFVLLKIVFKKDFKITVVSFLLLLTLILTSFLGKMVHGYPLALSYIMFFVTMLLCVLICINYSDEIKFEPLVFSFSTGIILATVLSLFFRDNGALRAYIRVLDQGISSGERLCGFYPDPNFFAAQTVTAFGCMLLIANKSKIKPYITMCYAFLLVACGTISLSKSFAISILLVMLLWLLSMIQMKVGFSRIFILMSLLCLTVLVILSSGVFDEQIQEFIMRFSSVHDASELTTGRSDLWIEYLSFLWENPAEFIWGQGFTSVFNGVSKGSHNTIIQLIYQFGLLGSAAMLFLWYNLSNRLLKRNNEKLFPILTLLASCFFMWMGLDMLFFDDFFFLIMIFIFGRRYLSKNDIDY